jgi:hypothetical protein
MVDLVTPTQWLLLALVAILGAVRLGWYLRDRWHRSRNLLDSIRTADGLLVGHPSTTLPAAAHKPAHGGYPNWDGAPERFKGDALRSGREASCKQQGRVTRAVNTRSYAGSNPAAIHLQDDPQVRAAVEHLQAYYDTVFAVPSAKVVDFPVHRARKARP